MADFTRERPMLLLLLTACCVPGWDKAVTVADKVTDPDRMIHDYEWFHTANANVGARTSQIASTKSMLVEERDPAEKSRLRTDLGGQQQSCRELVAEYNANAAKVTFGSFKGWSLPESINPIICE